MLTLIYVTVIIMKRLFLIVKAQLLHAALPYWNPCLVWDPLATRPSIPHIVLNYVMTLFADATVIPLTLSSDATFAS